MWRTIGIGQIVSVQRARENLKYVPQGMAEFIRRSLRKRASRFEKDLGGENQRIGNMLYPEITNLIRFLLLVYQPMRSIQSTHNLWFCVYLRIINNYETAINKT